MRKFALVDGCATWSATLPVPLRRSSKSRSFVGFAGTTCGSWIDARATKRSLAIEYWALGFVSGWNVLGSAGNDVLENVDANAVWIWLDNQCRCRNLSNLLSTR